MIKSFCEACEHNKAPILAVLEKAFAGVTRVLEIGSGTGQHAVYFAAHLPGIAWQTSDVADRHAGIQEWIDEAALANVRAPLALDVDAEWPAQTYDGAFSANTAHIMSWPQVTRMFAGIGRVLEPGGVFCLYGPFGYAGQHTSASNARFDKQLRARAGACGIRDFEAIDELAQAEGLALVRDTPMPANNRTLIWHKPASKTGGLPF